MKIKSSPIAVLILLNSLTLPIFAESVHLGKAAVTKQEVIQLLMPEDEIAPINTRGIRLHSGEQKAMAVSSTTQKPRSLSMEVFFEFNSSQLSPQAKDQLMPVGQALESNQLSGVQFTLEGHTDAVGSDHYNMQLSKARALSVKTFFVNEFQVSGNRIAAFGKGESELLDQNNPGSEKNRRVKIIAN